MTFPSATGTVQDSLSEAWTRARSAAGTIKSRAQQLHAITAAGPSSAGLVLDFATLLADAKVQLIRSRDTPGIGPYAQAQINNGSINVATEFNAMMAAIDTTIAWIIANYPKDGSGWLLHSNFTVDNSGRTEIRQFTAPQTAGLRTTLDALIATID